MESFSSETKCQETGRGRGSQVALWLPHQQPLRDEEENDAGNKPSALVCSFQLIQRSLKTSLSTQFCMNLFFSSDWAQIRVLNATFCFYFDDRLCAAGVSVSRIVW